MPKTLSLAAFAFLIALVIAVPAGIVAALRRNTVIDYAASVLAFVGVSMPSFWFGIILILIFAVRFRVAARDRLRRDLTEDGVIQWARHLILPSLAVGAGYAAILMRFVRAGLLEVLGSDYVRTARAKGSRERASSSAMRCATR